MNGMGFRQSNAWLHTWVGLLLGWLLYAVFLTGTLSFFQDEISYWMKPELHAATPGPQSAQLALQQAARTAVAICWCLAARSQTGRLSHSAACSSASRAD